MDIKGMRQVISCIEYKDWNIIIHASEYDRPYLQVGAAGTCSQTGEPYFWTGRKWFLSPHMTKSELVQTAFKAVMTAEEHEVREHFKYRDVTIFDPHYDVDQLAELRGQGAEVLDAREEKKTTKIEGLCGDVRLPFDQPGGEIPEPWEPHGWKS